MVHKLEKVRGMKVLTKPQISSFQLCIIFVVSRLFSIFTYRPQNYSVGAVTASICIIIAMLISFLIFLPTLTLIGKKADSNVSDIGFIHFGNYAKIFSFCMALVCIFLCVECLTQFTFFMSSTLYLSSTPIFFLLPMIIVTALICRKGIEAVARLSGMVFVGMAFSIVFIAILSLSQAENYNIEPIKYDNISQAVMFTVDKITHTTEIIPFLILCENAKGSLKKSAIVFLSLSGIFLEIISFATISVLGEYRKTILFPFYTLSAMSQNSLTDRMSLAYIVIWVFMSVIKLSVYFLAATKSVKQLMQPNKKFLPTALCACLIFFFGIFTCQNIVSIEIMYWIILTGIPIIVLAVLFPFSLFIKQKLNREVKHSE